MSWRPALLTGVVVVAALSAGACGEPRRVERKVERAPLDLAVPRQSAQVVSKGVEPVFVPFDELAGGITPPDPSRLKPVYEVRDRSEPLFYAEVEPNNGAAAASPVEVPAFIQGHIHPLPESDDGDHDWYSFLVERDEPGVMEMDLSAVSNLDLALEVFYDSVKGRTRLLAIDNAGRGKAEKLPNFNLVNGRYYLHIYQTDTKKPAWNVVQPYRLSLRMKELSTSAETEPNDHVLSAVPLTLGEDMSGLINRREDEDWYVMDLLQLSNYSYLTVELLPPMGTTLEMTLLTQSKEELTSITAREGQKASLPNLAVLEGATAYYARIVAKGKKVPPGEYTLSVTNHPLTDRIEVEPDDAAGMALRLYWEEPLAGWLSHDGDEDWFYLEPGADMPTQGDDGRPEVPALNLVLGGVPGVDLVLDVVDSDKETLLGRYDSGGRGEGEEIPNMGVPDRLVYFRVHAARGYNANANYHLQARAVLTRGKEVEPNNTLETGNALTTDSEKILGYLAPLGDRDCFVNVALPGSLRLDAPAQAAARVSGYTAAGMLYFQETAPAGESLGVPGRDGEAVSICLELTPDQKKAPREPYVLTFGGDLPLDDD